MVATQETDVLASVVGVGESLLGERNFHVSILLDRFSHCSPHKPKKSGLPWS